MDGHKARKSHLLAECDKLKQRILLELGELYFMRHGGPYLELVVPPKEIKSPVKNSKDRVDSQLLTAAIKNHLEAVTDDVLRDERNFSHKLNLKFDPEAEAQAAAATAAASSSSSSSATASDTKPSLSTATTTTAVPTTITTSTLTSSSSVSALPGASSTTTTTAASTPTHASQQSTKANTSQTLSGDEAVGSQPEALTANSYNSATATATSPSKPAATPLATSTQKSDSDVIYTHTHPSESDVPNKRKRSDTPEPNIVSSSPKSTTHGAAGDISPPPDKKPRDESPKGATNNRESNDTSLPMEIDDVDRRTPERVIPIPSKEESPTRISKVVEPMVTPAASAEVSHRQLHDRIKHEAEVQARIDDLLKQGLWSAKRLPKCQEPPRPKVHWDYLIEEMKWLATDFAAERRWKRKMAKKMAYSAVKYTHDKKCAIERAKKDELNQRKKAAAGYAREIKSFWSSIEKIVDIRQQTKLEETRKKAWNLHLKYILDQTDKFSNTLEEANPTPPTKEIDYLNSQESVTKEPVINNDEKQAKQKVDDMAAGAESIQPKGNTLETTTVSTKVPFLLKHTLREYQHIGLDWLSAMYKKQLNGILADEMGLGKTIQTIALLAHLACEEQEWGPHLIVVPTSVMLNWEMEFKKWCPAFKILTYYGTPKERKAKRQGWSRPNSFHVCITSYRIVIQDHAAFRRKQWTYFILDEAHYIKNFKSQRWQMLLNFNSQRRLLLTGTPLQNDLMELWSLMHFLMPNLFDSYREFKDWFVNPLTGMVEGSQEYNQELVQRLHKILRPFLLRRLKADVEKQLPSKREIIRLCRLSKRQRFLYEEFMSLSKTKETLASGNFLSVINVLMQLRKVCNHPNLFEPRPTISPFMMGSIAYKVPGILMTPLDYNPCKHINMSSLQLLPVEVGCSLTSTAKDYIRSKVPSKKKFLEVIDEVPSKQNSDIHDDGSSSVMEVDDAQDAIFSDIVNDAYSAVKTAQSEDKLSRLRTVAEINENRCTKSDSFYYSDLKDYLYLNQLKHLTKSEGETNRFSNGNGRIICSLVNDVRSRACSRFDLLSSVIDEAIKTPEQLVASLTDTINRYVFCVPGASAGPVSLHVSHQSSSKKVQEIYLKETLYEQLTPKFNLLSKIATNMRTTFPELRLIEYDCGKLQTLGRLLTELKSNDHRVLIFTQMSRMLDILEQFLNYYGYTYLRLDGATKIDQRQILMERFNSDKRIFCFILSTRSGGIGVNLTGADTVIFYDSDWNPTMDAQAQDRCHRIGQTRDVSIYRLICEDTIEQNIYHKAQQKRALGDLAIEDGNFNASSLKRHKIQELFEPTKEPIGTTITEVVDEAPAPELTKLELMKLEQALSKGEQEAGEDMDVDAIKVAKNDEETDLREFDENIPLTEEGSPVEKSEKEQKIDFIVSQMTPVEQYAVRFLESLQKPKNQKELEQAELEYRQELESKKTQWEQSRIEMLKEQSTRNEPQEETMLTYPNGAKMEHVHYMLDGEKKVEEMPLWAPPTPPTSPPSPVEDSAQYHYQPPMTPAMAARINAMGGLGNIFGGSSDSNKSDTRHFIDEKDLYVDYTSHYLYEPDVMVESQLPPVHQSYTDNETTSYTIGSKKIRLTGTPVVPMGYFQTPNTQSPHLQQHLQSLTKHSIPSATDGASSITAIQTGQRKPKVRRDEVICFPKSIFDKQTPNYAKIRRELKLQKLRCVTKGNDSDPFAMQKFFHSFALNPLGQSLQQENIVSFVNKQIQMYPQCIIAYEQEQIPPWTFQEEWALLMVIQHLQDLPVNLAILTPGHTPNWELVSEVVSDIGYTLRSQKMCEYHFTSNVQKREMTRDSSWDERAAMASSQGSADGSQQPPSKKSKKHKNQQQSADGGSGGQLSGSQQSTSSKSNPSGANAQSVVPFKPSKTGSLLAHDKSLQQSFSERYDIIKRIRQSRPKPVIGRFAPRERAFSNQHQTLPLRSNNRLIYYERPLKPEAIIQGCQ